MEGWGDCKFGIMPFRSGDGASIGCLAQIRTCLVLGANIASESRRSPSALWFMPLPSSIKSFVRVTILPYPDRDISLNRQDLLWFSVTRPTQDIHLWLAHIGDIPAPLSYCLLRKAGRIRIYKWLKFMLNARSTITCEFNLRRQN
jgi:hypothetical protein